MRALTEPASVADQLKRTGYSAVHIHLDLDALDPAWSRQQLARFFRSRCAGSGP